MTDIATHYHPPAVTPPGETLLDLLADHNMSQVELAKRLDLTPKTINGIIKGTDPISPTTALQLERALGTPAAFWLTRESRYREHLARETDHATLAKQKAWLTELPVADMVRLGWITTTRRTEDRMVALLRYFGVGSVAAWRAHYEQPLAALRASPRHPCKPGALAAWLRRAELEASAVTTGPFTAEAFRATLPTLRELTRSPDPHAFVPALTDACAAHGVAVVLVPAPRGCPVSGATRWLSPKKAMLALSLRHGTSDSLWFSFFHEAAHILLHGKRMQFFDLEGALGSEDEAEADAFARDMLIPPAGAKLLDELADDADADAIVEIADRLGVAPAIVLGRLQHDGRVGWNRHARLRMRYQWRVETS